jgi:hypothetical protein
MAAQAPSRAPPLRSTRIARRALRLAAEGDELLDQPRVLGGQARHVGRQPLLDDGGGVHGHQADADLIVVLDGVRRPPARQPGEGVDRLEDELRRGAAGRIGHREALGVAVDDGQRLIEAREPAPVRVRRIHGRLLPRRPGSAAASIESIPDGAPRSPRRASASPFASGRPTRPGSRRRRGRHAHRRRPGRSSPARPPPRRRLHPRRRHRDQRRRHRRAPASSGRGRLLPRFLLRRPHHARRGDAQRRRQPATG